MNAPLSLLANAVSLPSDRERHHLNQALRAATLVYQAASYAKGDRQQRRIVSAAVAVAKAAMSRDAQAAGCLRDRGPARSSIDLLRLLAEQLEGDGHLALAAGLLESLFNLPTIDALSAGRILGDRARLSRKRGDIDLAADQFRELQRRAKRLGSVELEARAWAGIVAIAQVRGNFPEMRRAALTAARLCREAKLNRLAAMMEIGLGVQAGTAGDHSTAIVHFWSAYQLVDGDARLEPEILTDLAHTLLQCDRPREARAAAIAVLNAKPNLRISCAGLGVYAQSSAGLNDREAVDRVAREAVSLARRGDHPRDAAGLFHDCALAYDVLSLPNQAGVLRRRGHAIATKHGFHDLAFGTAEPPAPRRQIVLTPKAEVAAREISEFEEPRNISELLAVGARA